MSLAEVPLGYMTLKSAFLQMIGPNCEPASALSAICTALKTGELRGITHRSDTDRFFVVELDYWAWTLEEANVQKWCEKMSEAGASDAAASFPFNLLSIWRVARTADGRMSPSSLLLVKEDEFEAWCLRHNCEGGSVVAGPHTSGHKPELAAQPQYSEAQARRWYLARIEKWPQDQLPPSRDSDRSAARKMGYPVSLVDELRKDLAPLTWKRRGRRASKSSES